MAAMMFEGIQEGTMKMVIHWHSQWTYNKISEIRASGQVLGEFV
jgi:hypothetical protein